MTTIDPNSAQAALFEKLGLTQQSDAQKAKSDHGTNMPTL